MDTFYNKHEQKPPQNDFTLLAFPTYEDYLDSLYNELDKCYLQDTVMCRKIAEYGFRRDSKTLSRDEFYEKKTKVNHYLMPVQPNVLASSGFRYGDPLQTALAIRERSNRIGVISTIIFIDYNITKSVEVSGYIDYAHSLLKKDWEKFFKENVPIYPDKNDLGFYDWKKGITVINDSLYFKVLMSPDNGLMFQNKFDRRFIVPDPFCLSPGRQTVRQKIKSNMYNNCILIDHVLRTRK